MRNALRLAVIIIAPMLFLSPGIVVPYSFVVFILVALWDKNAA